VGTGRFLILTPEEVFWSGNLSVSSKTDGEIRGLGAGKALTSISIGSGSTISATARVHSSPDTSMLSKLCWSVPLARRYALTHCPSTQDSSVDLPECQRRHCAIWRFQFMSMYSCTGCVTSNPEIAARKHHLPSLGNTITVPDVAMALHLHPYCDTAGKPAEDEAAIVAGSTLYPERSSI
jgi:hypothetical protein